MLRERISINENWKFFKYDSEAEADSLIYNTRPEVAEHQDNKDADSKPDMPMPGVLEIISLNYQGEGIRDGEAYSHLQGIRTHPLYPAFHEAFPDKVIVSSETASALSSRGTYLFPVYKGNSRIAWIERRYCANQQPVNGESFQVQRN